MTLWLADFGTFWPLARRASEGVDRARVRGRRQSASARRLRLPPSEMPGSFYQTTKLQPSFGVARARRTATGLTTQPAARTTVGSAKKIFFSTTTVRAPRRRGRGRGRGRHSVMMLPGGGGSPACRVAEIKAVHFLPKGQAEDLANLPAHQRAPYKMAQTFYTSTSQTSINHLDYCSVPWR